MLTELLDPGHAVDLVDGCRPDPRDLETSPLYGDPLGHWDRARRLDEAR